MPRRVGGVSSSTDLLGVLESFCCSGQHQETRQTKDHPKAAYEAWHTAWRYPFRARRDWQSQAHLHTTLNKSRDEKLEIVGAWPTYPFGKRACIMGEDPQSGAGVGNRTRGDPGSPRAGVVGLLVAGGGNRTPRVLHGRRRERTAWDPQCPHSNRCGVETHCMKAKGNAPPPGLEPGTYRLTAERSAN